MKDVIILILALYSIAVVLLGGFSLDLKYEKPYINFWKKLRKDLNIIGCIIIYILLFPAILWTIITDISLELYSKICDLFYIIFKRK